jgi:hypothetical protein
MPLFASLVPADVRARHEAWRRSVRERLCVEEGSSDDRHLTRVILEWRMLRATTRVMDRNGQTVPPENRTKLERLERLLGEGFYDPVHGEAASEAA